MSQSIDRLANTATLFVIVLLALILGGLAWTGLHAAETAAAEGAADAAEALRLMSAFLLVTLVFLVVTLLLIGTHLVALIRVPLKDMRDTLDRMRGGTLRERIVPEGPKEIRALAHAINAMAADLEHQRSQVERTVAMGTIDALIDGIAHEVHTPLTSLKVTEHLLEQQALALRDRNDLPDDVKDQIRKALRFYERNRSAIARLEALSRALREVVRHDKGEQRRDPNLIVTAAVAITHHRMPGGTRVVTTLAATRTTESVTSEVFHAVHELLLNASRAVTDQDMIEVWTRDEGEGVAIGVRDTGRGIPPEVLELLESRGLGEETPTSGLFIAKRTIESLGGTLECRTAEGIGTAWTIRLPPRPRQRAAALHEEEAPEVPTTSPTT